MRLTKKGGLLTMALLMQTIAAMPAAGAGADPAMLPDDGFPDQAVPPAAKPLPFNLQAAFFLKNESSSLRRDAVANPAAAYLPLKDNVTFLETRFTLSDQIDALPGTRWLLKTYTTTTKESPSTLGQDSRVDELFFDKRTSQWFASIGKRRVNWGHAQGFNPVNVVAPARNPLDPSFETEGQRMLWASYSGASTLDVLYTRGNERTAYGGDRYRWGLRWDWPGVEGDLALYAYDGGDRPDGQPFERMLGLSFSRTLMPGWSWYGELANFSHNYRRYYRDDGSSYDKSGSYTQAVTGVLLDLGGRSSFFVEGLVNSQAYSPEERDRYIRALAASTPGIVTTTGAAPVSTDFIPLSMNRSYLLAGFRTEYREKFVFSLNWLAARDGSCSARAEAGYTLSDYYEVKASYVHNVGGRTAEFANYPYSDFLQLQLSASF
jgi:hypothetical protein